MDPVADILSRIKNALLAKHTELVVPYSNLKNGIAKVLVAEGYLSSYKIAGKSPKNEIKIVLKYGKDSKPVINDMRQVSKSGQRMYSSRKKLPRVLGNLGISIISTSRGIMTDKEARKKNLGGEVLCKVW